MAKFYLKTCLVNCLTLKAALSFGLYAKDYQQQEIDKALKVYGQEAGNLSNKAQDALTSALPEAERFLENLNTTSPSADLGIAPPKGDRACQGCQSQPVESLIAGHSSLTQEKVPSSDVLVFVSLAMPEASLKQLADEARLQGARLILRGLVGNSFEQTSAKIQELKLRSDLEIDPLLFQLFEVTTVPTFVRCRVTSEGPRKQGHDRITGNIALTAALDKFKAWGDLA